MSERTSVGFSGAPHEVARVGNHMISTGATEQDVTSNSILLTRVEAVLASATDVDVRLPFTFQEISTSLTRQVIDASTSIELVIAATTVDDIVALSTDQPVGPLAAVDDVVSPEATDHVG